MPFTPSCASGARREGVRREVLTRPRGLSVSLRRDSFPREMDIGRLLKRFGKDRLLSAVLALAVAIYVPLMSVRAAADAPPEFAGFVICSVYHAADAGPGGGGGDQPAPQRHCPLCLAMGSVLPPAPPIGVLAPRDVEGASLRPAEAASPARPFWRDQRQARAPPVRA